MRFLPYLVSSKIACLRVDVLSAFMGYRPFRKSAPKLSRLQLMKGM